MALLSTGRRPVTAVDASDIPLVLSRLREALFDDGDTIFPATAERLPHAPLDAPATVALVIETSGSTASPKRVALSADALIASADATHDALGGPGRWLLTLPAHYIAGAQVLVRSLVAGTEPIVLRGEGFDAASFAEAASRLDARTPRYTSLVPVQLARIVEAAERDAFVAAALTSFDAVLVGGQALAASLAARAEALGARIVRTYGSSETSGGCVYDGRPLGGVDARIVDGRIELAGSMLAEEYLDDDARTAETFRVESGRRWYRTGDLGELRDGVLRVTGRADDVIISGGVKVSLGEVENLVRTVDGFDDAVVVAVDHPTWGQSPAVVARRSEVTEAPGTLGELAAHVGDIVGPAGRPSTLYLVDTLPLLASGKPDRRAIEALVSS
ncbi:AMP-binding protein [Agromyces atrinae]|nr:AMP-binding protein [Agromyces atrinae]MCI2957293.1 AMP-binding protein [Agromyces atrinae]